MLDKSASLTAPPATVTRTESKVPRALQKYLALDDFEPVARRRIPKFLYGYISGGAETDAAMRDNRKAFDEYGFVPRVLNDVSGRDQTTTLFGKILCLAVRHSADGLFGASRLSRRHRADESRESRERADDS